MTLECRLIKFDDNGNIIADIINISADKKILDNKGNIDSTKIKFISYDGVNHKYLEVSKIVGTAFSDGNSIK